MKSRRKGGSTAKTIFTQVPTPERLRICPHLTTENFHPKTKILEKGNWRPHEESNLDLRFRKPLFYPLNYGDLNGFFYEETDILSSRQLDRFDQSEFKGSKDRLEPLKVSGSEKSISSLFSSTGTLFLSRGFDPKTFSQ